MLHSPNLNVVIRSLEKISIRLARDFVELENLQNNNFTAIKFANSCYKRIEETIINELSKVRPDYNVQLTDGRQIIYNPNSKYQYNICPIDGLLTLSRSLGSFTSFVALEYLSPDNSKEVISTTILNVLANEFYICEKGSGAFLNNRKSRSAKRDLKDNIICSLSNSQLVNHPLIKTLENKPVIFQTSNCSSLEIAHFSCGKIDMCVFEASDQQFLKSLLLLAKESGGEILEKEGLIIVSSGKIIL